MEKAISLYRAGFEGSAYETEEFKTFAREFKRAFNRVASKFGLTNLSYHKMHFEVSVNFTAPDGQAWYLNTRDVRVPTYGCYMRKVRDYDDYVGGTNINFELEDIENVIADELERHGED